MIIRAGWVVLFGAGWVLFVLAVMWAYPAPPKFVPSYELLEAGQ